MNLSPHQFGRTARDCLPSSSVTDYGVRQLPLSLVPFKSPLKTGVFFDTESLCPAPDISEKLWRRFVFGGLLFLFLLSSGCAKVVPGRPADAHEKIDALALLRQGLAHQANCGCCIDAKVSVSFHSPLRSGSLTGYLQAKAPAQFRFLSLGPLDQPVFLLACDGERFRLIVVPDAKAFEGSTKGKTFTKYAPPGVRPEFLFYWFVGGIEPGNLKVESVWISEEERGFWFDLSGSIGEKVHRVLVNEQFGRIVRHQVLDERGGIVVEARYSWSDFEHCCLPENMTIESPAHSITLSLSFSECEESVTMSKKDLELKIPSAFTRIPVK